MKLVDFFTILTADPSQFLVHLNSFQFIPTWFWLSKYLIWSPPKITCAQRPSIFTTSNKLGRGVCSMNSFFSNGCSFSSINSGEKNERKFGKMPIVSRCSFSEGGAEDFSGYYLLCKDLTSFLNVKNIKEKKSKTRRSLEFIFSAVRC